MKNDHQDTSSGDVKRIKTTKIVYPQLYSYTLPDEDENTGSQKIGYTEKEDVDLRIREQTNTPAKKHRYEKQWSAPAFFANTKEDFKDKVFHKFLIKNGVENRTDLGTEWFYFNGTPEKSKQLFDTFREQGFSVLQTSGAKAPYSLRSEQEDAVVQAKTYFDNHEEGEFLWNAKPRFGKTLASYDLAKRLGARKVLIVTNRPAIANSWFDDFEQFIDGYHFISETSSLDGRPTISRQQYISSGMNKPQVTFLSLQDLKGSKYFGGPHDKLSWVADLSWDLLIIDEAHEGIDTNRTNAAFDIVKREHTLHLSGTPFKALASNKFPAEAIFNWTYLDEQERKRQELQLGESGDHTDLPDLKLFTYRISQMTADAVNEGIEIEDQARDYAFDLNEFFATNNQKFTHEEDVKNFLKNLSNNTKYPFSTPELRDQLRHTFWYVGNRVESVKALEQLLKKDDIFKEYKIVVAAGDGRSFEEEEADFKSNEKSFDKVKKAIAENPKTITLSCGQLTTGVTVKEWSAVLMLSDIKTPAQYMQAAFRAQNPFRFPEGGQLKAKKSAYLFDFAPTRVLEIYDHFANSLNPRAVKGEITEAERKDNIKELLNYFPVISEDTEGQMVELDAEMVLTFPNALAATEIVKARFMTNLLFNDNIKGVFHFPQEVEDILDKMQVEKNKRAEKTKTTLDLDEARKVEQTKQTKINENSSVILGGKIYRANVERFVDNALNYETPEETMETLPGQVMSVAEIPIAKYKETYHKTNAEIKDLREEITEKVKLKAAEFEASEQKDPEALKADLIKLIEQDLVHQNVEQEEARVVEQVQKTKEEEVREHLRAFTRTIPMFIMANSSKETITIENFDEEVSEEDFIDLTNITKAEFHKLRDGFDYEEDGQRKHFDGVFDTYKFNASIAEFVAEKKQRSNYFSTDEDIFELIPNQKNNQIFTPRKVVKMMVDGLEKEQPELFRRTDSTFIDLYMKSGMYITEIVKKLFSNTRHNYSSDTECLKHILENQVYGLSPTGVLHGITTSYIFGFDAEHNISGKNFAQHDLLPQAKEGTVAEKLGELYNGGNMMKFDAVVGNPPYQTSVSNSASNQHDMPVYHHFYNSAFEIADVVILISPARFLSGAGYTPKPWNQMMLDDEHLKVISFEPTSSTVFPGTDIKGGVVVLLRNANKQIGPIGLFTSTPVLTGIAKKIKPYSEKGSIKDIMKVQTKMNLDKVYETFPEYRSSRPQSSINDVRLGTDSFTAFSKLLTVNPESGASVKILGLVKNKRDYRYIARDYILHDTSSTDIDKYKVVVTAANGKGDFGEALSSPLVCYPGEGHTMSFRSLGSFDIEEDAHHALKYIKTKFVRAMIGIKKTTQHMNPGVLEYVPIQDFSSISGIDWTKSITEIDQQLYKKYGLNQEEIDFIESKVKPME